MGKLGEERGASNPLVCTSPDPSLSIMSPASYTVMRVFTELTVAHG